MNNSVFMLCLSITFLLHCEVYTLNILVADIAFDVDDLTTEQSDQLNLCSADYGMKGNDYLE